MLKKFTTIGKQLNKQEQQAIKGGIWDSLEECQENCGDGCLIGYFGNRWACGS